MKKKGFTLIELLAVIVILAVIALIATPIILNIVEKARKSAFLDSAYGIEKAAKLNYMEGILDGESEKVKTYQLGEGIENELKYNGTNPKGGSITVNKEGVTSLALHNGKWCAIKSEIEKTITIIEYNEETCKVEGVEEPPPTDKTPEEIMTDSSDVIDQDGNKRYVGENPNNYVSFNGKLFRIIGVFEGKIKIIQNDFYGRSKQWHTSNVNTWSTSSLATELNGTYWNTISSTYQAMVDQNHEWKIGASDYNATRGEAYSNLSSNTWTGKVGLMNTADYGYATNGTSCDTNMYTWYNGGTGNEACYSTSNNWLANTGTEQWTTIPYSNNLHYVLSVHPNGAVSWDSVNNAYGVRPVLYLKSDVKITSGTGTSSNSYILLATDSFKLAIEKQREKDLKSTSRTRQIKTRKVTL